MTVEIKPGALKVLVFGLGAIGTYVGGSLVAAGQAVTFVERPDVAQMVHRDGLLLVNGGIQQRISSARVVISAEAALEQGDFDVCVLAVKSFDTESVIESIRPVAAQFPPILCLQNGVDNENLLSRAIGANNVIPGTVTTAVGRRAAGQIVVEKLRGIGIAATHPIAPRLIEMFNHAGLRAREYANPEGMKWSKMLTNLLANATSAILDLPPAVIFAHPGLFRIETAMLKEALAVMNALKIPVLDLPSIPVRALVGIIQKLPIFLSQPLLYQALGKGRGGKMPSFHIDLYAGRGKSEVDYLNGAVVRFGQKVDVPTPVNAWLNQVLLKLTNRELPKESLAHQPEKFIAWLTQKRL